MNDTSWLGTAAVALLSVAQFIERVWFARSKARQAAAETGATEAGTQTVRNTTAIGHWQGYADRLEKEIVRLQQRLDAAEERERAWLVAATRQEEQIRGLTVEVGELRAMLDAARRGDRGP